MMTYTFYIVMSFSVLIAGITGAARFYKMDRAFYPFIFCTWLACINEMASYFFARRGLPNIANNNMYILAEVLLINWQAKRWKLFNGHGRLYIFIQLLCISVWFYEIHSPALLQQLHFYSRLFFAIVIVLSSIHISSRLMLSHEKGLAGNPVFLICTGYIIFFTCKILVDAVWLYDSKNSTVFLYAIYAILAWINVLVNILFTIAVLCIPPKPQYIIL